MVASAPSGQEPVGRPERFQGRHAGLDAAQDRTEAAHGSVQVHAVARMRARDEAAVAIHVALRVRAAGLPECGHVRERQGFLAEHDDLFIDLKPRYLVLLKEDVARLLLLRGVENAVDVLRHGSLRNFYHGTDTWQTLLTDLEATQAVIARLLQERFWKEAGAVYRSIESDANVECPSRPKPALLVYDLDLLIEHLAGKRSIAIRRQKGDNPAASPSQTSASISRRKCGVGEAVGPFGVRRHKFIGEQL